MRKSSNTLTFHAYIIKEREREREGEKKKKEEGQKKEGPTVRTLDNRERVVVRIRNCF